MNLCTEYDHAATIQTTPDGPRWLEQPKRVHIAAELMDDDEAVSFIAAAYTITAGCNDRVMHGDLTTPTQAHATTETDGDAAADESGAGE